MKNKILYCLGLLIWVAAAVIVSQLLLGIVMILVLGKDKFVQPVWTAVFSALSYSLALAMIVLVKIRKHKGRKTNTTRKELGLRDLPTWTDIGLAPVGFIVYILIAAALTALFNIFPWFNADEVQNVGFSYYIFGMDRIVAFLTLVVIAPIAEEVIFRGWLYGKIRKNLPLIPSILLVSLLFGAIHMQWNVAVNVFALSVVLCGLREITGTVYSGILLHMIKNGVAFYLLYVLGLGI